MAASAAALTGDTITLLRDAESIPYFQAKNDKSITFDLNGHYVEDLAIRSITVTIIDSSDEKTGRVGNLDFSCWYGVENPNFVFDSFKDDVERNDYHEGQGYQYLEMWTERPAKLTLLGGSYKAIHLSNCADVEIAGAYIFNADEITYTTVYAINVGEYQYVSISMKSGVLAGETSIGNRVSVSVSGGIFSKEVPSSHLAEGYTCIKISEGIYQVVAK